MDTFALIDNQVITADGPSGTQVPIPTATMMDVTLEVEGAVSGTSPTLHVWLQTSTDKEEWFDEPLPAALKSDAAGANVSAVVDKRNINGDTAMSAQGEKHKAKYPHIAAGWVRANWKIGGTATPTFNNVKCKASVK